jgi:hypothetical protein
MASVSHAVHLFNPVCNKILYIILSNLLISTGRTSIDRYDKTILKNILIQG